jgi:hypothetical protein
MTGNSQYHQDGAGFLECFGIKSKVMPFEADRKVPNQSRLENDSNKSVVFTALEDLVDQSEVYLSEVNMHDENDSEQGVFCNHAMDPNRISQQVVDNVLTSEETSIAEKHEQLVRASDVKRFINSVTQRDIIKDNVITKSDVEDGLDWVTNKNIKTLLVSLIKPPNDKVLNVVAIVNIDYKNNGTTKKSQLLFPFNWKLASEKNSKVLVKKITYGMHAEKIRSENIEDALKDDDRLTWEDKVMSFMTDVIVEGYENYLPQGSLVIENQIRFLLSVSSASKSKGKAKPSEEMEKFYKDNQTFSTEEIEKLFENIKKIIGEASFDNEIKKKMKKVIKNTQSNTYASNKARKNLGTALYNLLKILSENSGQPAQVFEGGKKKQPVSKYDKMTVKELHEHCAKHNLHHPRSLRKAELIEIIQKKSKSKVKSKSSK